MKKIAILGLAALGLGLGACGDTSSEADPCPPGVLKEGCTDPNAASTNNATTSANNAATNTNNATTSANNAATSTNNAATNTNNATTTPDDPWPDCVYPEDATNKPTRNRVIPNMWWEGAYLGSGDRVDISLREIYCSPQYENIETILFVVSAGWCPNCPDDVNDVYQNWRDLREAGVLLIIIEAENRNSDPSTHDEAQTSVERYIGEGGPGFRVGDGETQPYSMILQNRMIGAFPTRFMVRKRDMMIIAASEQTPFRLPALQIARYPEADWANHSDNTLPTDVGEECRETTDCDTGTLIPECITARDRDTGELTGWTRGYCIGLDCASDAACGDGNVCIEADGGFGLCYAGCDVDDDCRSGYACRPASTFDSSSPSICLPE